MGHSQYDPAMQCRPAWNAGKTVGTKRPLTQRQIWAVRFFLDREGRLRDRALFDLAIDSKLRGCEKLRSVGQAVQTHHIASANAQWHEQESCSHQAGDAGSSSRGGACRMQVG